MKLGRVAFGQKSKYTVRMRQPQLEWDPAKNRANIQKHGVPFEEAIGVFGDEHGRILPDPEHSGDGEERFLLLGFSLMGRVLVVSHCWRRKDCVIRLISARRATRREMMTYGR